MKKIDGFNYNIYKEVFLVPMNFPKKYRKYIKENGKIKIQIYILLLDSLNDELRFKVPSIHRESGCFSNILDVRKYFGNCYKDGVDSGFEFNTRKVAREFKIHIKKSFIEMFKDFENNGISKDIATFESPWLLTTKQQRREKLNKINNG